MGIRGYRVYRWRHWYFIYYNFCDSYPSYLGVNFLATIPKDTEGFQRWLANKREEFDKLIEAHDKGEIDEEDVNMSDEPPKNDLFIEWIYEIDLDRLVYHVDSHPLFRLDNLPSDALFLKCIGFDHYGHRACVSSTPPEYRYNWDAPPPIVADAALELYKSQVVVDSAAISDLLSIPELMADREAARVQILQVIIGTLMRTAYVGLRVRESTQVSDHSKLPMAYRSLAFYLFDIAIDPQIFTNEAMIPFPSETPWRRQNICVHLATNLDDQRNIQAAVAGLVADAMKRTDNPRGIVYGVAFSIFHCVIVRIDTQRGFRVTHSDALQFLPSFYADSPSTPGITALARLSYRCDAEVIKGHLHSQESVLATI